VLHAIVAYVVQPHRVTSVALALLLLLDVVVCLGDPPLPRAAPPWVANSSQPHQQCSEQDECSAMHQARRTATELCKLPAKQQGARTRTTAARAFRLGFCDRFTLHAALHPTRCELGSASIDACEDRVLNVLEREGSARQHFAEFLRVLEKFDCNEDFSRWSCDNCQVGSH
jgi:hypothetical protein